VIKVSHPKVGVQYRHNSKFFSCRPLLYNIEVEDPPPESDIELQRQYIIDQLELESQPPGYDVFSAVGPNGEIMEHMVFEGTLSEEDHKQVIKILMDKHNI